MGRRRVGRRLLELLEGGVGSGRGGLTGKGPSLRFPHVSQDLEVPHPGLQHSVAPVHFW